MIIVTKRRTYLFVKRLKRAVSTFQTTNKDDGITRCIYLSKYMQQQSLMPVSRCIYLSKYLPVCHAASAFGYMKAYNETSHAITNALLLYPNSSHILILLYLPWIHEALSCCIYLTEVTNIMLYDKKGSS